MDDRTTNNEWLARQFEAYRPHLRRIAYRMLGSLTDTDDAVQEAWLRLARSDAAAVENLGGWLTTVVGRVCLDMLRVRNARREDYVGSWLPEPIVTVDDSASPEEEALLADSVGLALLVVLDTLSPAERLAFVMHDVFAVPFAGIAAVLDRSESAAQQLASRARRRVRGAREPDSDLARQRQVVDAFFAASRDGDFDALVAVLDPEVELRIDGGALRQEASLILRGAAAVARHTTTYSRLYPFVRPALVNGAAGAVVAPHGRLFSVMAFNVSNGKITQIDALLDPERLARLDLGIPPKAGSRSRRSPSPSPGRSPRCSCR
jgi:RNA polymerase sigma-70 factor (ECF subfamily)